MSPKKKQSIYIGALGAEYERGEQIGEGGGGTVYKCKQLGKSEATYAVKELRSNASSKQIKRFKNEVGFCLRQGHPNIVEIVDLNFSTEPLFCVMPYYPSTLRSALNDLDPNDVLPLFGNILEGVAHVHSLGVCHRDLKPENILVNREKSTAVIADFGIARIAEEFLTTAVDTKPREKMANLRYSAPEQKKRGQMSTIGPTFSRLDISSTKCSRGRCLTVRAIPLLAINTKSTSAWTGLCL